jgi:hypothetical protein
LPPTTVYGGRSEYVNSPTSMRGSVIRDLRSTTRSCSGRGCSTVGSGIVDMTSTIPGLDQLINDGFGKDS